MFKIEEKRHHYWMDGKEIGSYNQISFSYVNWV